jgi:hypothetical protein
LAIFDEGPEKEALNKALLTAEAAVRSACKLFGGDPNSASFEEGGSNAAYGALWWMKRDLEEMKKRYGPTRGKK